MSNQGTLHTCASHSLGKAIVEIFDDRGYDCNQTKTIEALRQSVQSDGKPRNPDDFDNAETTVEIAEISAHADGVLAPGSAHARPSARPPST